MKSIRAIAAIILFVSGTVAGVGVSAQDVAPVRVFDAGELAPNRYNVLERLWTGTWRAPFWFPSHDDAGAAVTALTNKAASLGADGVVNLHCLNDTGAWGGGYYCYGLAIKLR